MFLRAMQPEGARKAERSRAGDPAPALPAAWVQAASGWSSDTRSAAPLWPGGRRRASASPWIGSGAGSDVAEPRSR